MKKKLVTLILLILTVSLTSVSAKNDFTCNSENTGNLEHEISQKGRKFHFKAYYCGYTKNYTVKKFDINESENVIDVDIVMSGPEEPESLSSNEIKLSKSKELEPGKYTVKTEIDVRAEREYSKQDKLTIRSKGFLTKILNALTSFLQSIIEGIQNLVNPVL